jgi:rod shape determining protein RodA
VNKTLIFAISLSVIGILTQSLFSVQGGLYQLGFVIFGLFLYFVITTFVDSTFLMNISRPLSIGGLISLIILLGFGDMTRGARRWFFIGTFGLQPSMMFVPFFLLTLVMLLTILKPRKFGNVVRILLLAGIPLFLVFKQPDLGTALVLFATLMAVLIAARMKARHLILLLLLAMPIVIMAPRFLKTYQKNRIISFLNPQYDQYGVNYNSFQAEIAIGSGGIFGKGFLHSSQSKLSFLPEAHTDFVFAAFTETFGLFGDTILLGIYFLFLRSLLQKSKAQQDNDLYTLYHIGIFAFILIQFIFNVGMNLRLLPVVGVPLPFISYGGSSLLTIYVLLAIGEKLKEA